MAVSSSRSAVARARRVNLSAPPLHTKARGPHPLYPARALVPDDKVIP